MSTNTKEVTAAQSPKASAATKDVAPQGTAQTSEPSMTPAELESKLKELKQGFSRLGNKEKELEQKSKELDMYVKSYPDLVKIRSEYEALQKALVESPRDAYLRAGGKPETIAAKFAAEIFNDNPSANAIKGFQSTLTTLQSKLDKIEAAETAKEESQRRAEFEKQLQTAAEKYPILKESKSYLAIENHLATLKKESPDEATLEKAAERAEAFFKNEIAKVIKSGAITPEEVAEWIKKEEPKKEEPPKKVSTAVKKDETSKQPSAPSEGRKPLSLEEAKRRAIEQLKELRKTG